MKTCVACGMPMKEKTDFAMGDESKDYCVHCANEDGSMHTFKQKKESMTGFIFKSVLRLLQVVKHQISDGD